MADTGAYLEESYDDNLAAFDFGDGNVVLSDGCRLMRVQQHEQEVNTVGYGRQSIPMMMMPFGSSYRPQYPPPAFYFTQMQHQSITTDSGVGGSAYHYQQQPAFIHPIMIYKNEAYTNSSSVDLEDSIDSGNGRATPDTNRAVRDRSIDESGGTDTQSPCRKRKRFTADQTKQLENIFAQNSYPDTFTRDQFAQRHGISTERIQIWFQNRRSKWRRVEKTSCGEMPPKAQYGLLGAITKHAIKQGTVDREYNLAMCGDDRESAIVDQDTMQHSLVNNMMTTENVVKNSPPN